MKDTHLLGADGSVLPESVCPTCKYVMDAATDSKGIHRPSAGDFSVCAKCGEIMLFNEDLTLCEATLSDLMCLPSDIEAQLLHVQRIIREARLIK